MPRDFDPMSQQIPPEPPRKRRLHAEKPLVALIIIVAIVVAVQYTPYAFLSRDMASTVWGALVGLILGGFIFGWLRFTERE